VVSLTFLAGLGGYLVLNSQLFHDYVTRTILREINNVTGTRAEIDRLDLRPSHFTVTIYGLTLHGNEEPSQPPLLHIDRLSAQVGIHSLLRRQISLDTVSIDHPVVHTFCNSKGTINLAQAIGSEADKGEKKFSLTISHLLLTRGDLSYRDERIPLDADLKDLGVEVDRDPQSGRSSSSISYRDGFLRVPAYPPVRHSLTSKFVTSPSHISIEATRLVIGSSIVSIRGEIDDLSHPTVLVEYDVRLHTKDFGSTFGFAPKGAVILTGLLHYKNSPLRPDLLSLSGSGELSSDILELSNFAGDAKLEAIHARYELDQGNLRAHDIKLRLLGGNAIASLNIEHLDNTPAYKVAVSVNGVSLQKLRQAVRSEALTRLPLDGTLNGTVHADWTGSIKNVVSHCNLQFAAPTMRGESDLGIVFPVVGAADLTYNRSRSLLTIQPTTLQLGSLSLALQGELGDRSHLNINASVDDLQRFANVVASFGSEKTAPSVSGSAQLKAQMQGSARSPHFVGFLSGKNLVIRDSRWSSVSATFELSPSRLSLKNASLVNAYQGTVRINGDTELREWSYIPSNLTQIDVSLHSLPISEVQNLAGRHYADKGEASGDVSLRGFASDLSGSGTIDIINAQAYGEPLQTVTAHFTANHGSVTSALNIRSHAGSATGNLSYIFPSRTYSLGLNATGLVLQELRAIRRRNLPIRGIATISANGEGSLDDPKLSALVEINEAEFHGNTISQIRGKADLVGRRVDVECRSQIAGASLHMRGHTNLVGDYFTEATVDSDTLQFERLQDIYSPGLHERLQGQTEFHLAVKGPLRRPSQLEAHVNIPVLSLGYESLLVRAVNPIQLDYSRSLLTLGPAEFQGSGTSFRLEGSVPLQSSSLLNIHATGSIDAEMLRILAPDVKSSGALSFDVHTVGSLSSPSLEGQILLKNVAVATPTAAPLAVDSLSGTLTLGNGKLRIVNLSGRSAEGELSMAGTIVYQPHLQFDISAQAKALRLRYAGLKMLIDTDLALVGQASSPTIRGKASVTELSLASDLDINKLSEGFTHRNASHQAGLSDSIKLAVLVESNNRLKASNSQLSVEGNLKLQVLGTAADPVIVGRMDLTSAEFLYRARRYQLQRGFVVFDNPHQTRPTLDVSVTTTVQQYNLTLAARGPLEKLNTSYVSDPPLPTADIISLVAFGNTATQTSNASAQGADSILASQVGGQLSNKMQGLTGISGLRIDPLVGGSNRNPSARIAIQQRVTKNFLFTFSTDVSQPGSETVEGKYQINRRWSVGVARDPVGGVSAEGRYHTRF
jgi:translocation and assembly module TamB